MHCKKCKANYEERSESTGEWYGECLCGQEQVEFQNGELGCNLHYKTINRMLEQIEYDDWQMANDPYMRYGY